MKTKKYIVWPGYVTSKLDGDRHYISASQLMHLHGVQISECVIIRGPEDHYKLRRIHKDLIDLSPREDGKYKSYGQQPEQIAKKMKNGDRVIIKHGATAWMREHGYWIDGMGDSIDGFTGKIIKDYTDLAGNDTHYAVDIGLDFEVGINPKWLSAYNTHT